jgi:hypothetical protein
LDEKSSEVKVYIDEQFPEKIILGKLKIKYGRARFLS